MPSLEEIKRENARLKSQAEVRRDFVMRNMEKKRLMQENARLRNPKTYAFLSGAGRLIKNVGSRTSNAMKDYSKKQQEIRKQQLTKQNKSAKKTRKLVSTPQLNIRDLI